tara:strand:+ start:693 stop:1094 length:402 start_codon:yes stop_codon:yes gene_type:complete
MKLTTYKDNLNPTDLENHRVWIAIQSEALMARYFHIALDPAVKREIVRGWMDTLQDYSQKQISDAIKSHINNKPKIRPHEGIIRQTIIDARKDTIKPPPPLKKLERAIPPLARRQELAKEAAKILRSFSSKVK